MFRTKLTNFLLKNCIPMIYAVFAFAWELLSLIYFDLSPKITKPVFPCILLAIGISVICLFQDKRWRAAVSALFLTIQIGIALACNYLFLSNGTIFEWSMYNQRNDAYGTVEHLILSRGLVIQAVLMLMGYTAFLILHIRFCKRENLLYAANTSRKPLAFTLCVLLVFAVVYTPQKKSGENTDLYRDLLYDTNNNYQELGLSGNLIYEVLHRAPGVEVDAANLDGLSDRLFSERLEISPYYGVSKGNNLVMILAESFEWYPLTMYDEEITQQIYPNLWKMMQESVKLTNFYAREKTDTAEALMLLGSNPSGKYLHYDFPDNAYPYALPALFRAESARLGCDTPSIRSFHHSEGQFYNRKQLHVSLGFDSLTDVYDMKAAGMPETWLSEMKERNLDSNCIAYMKDEMFPADEHFFTFWISFCTHGFYDERSTLKEYYERFDEYGVFPKGDKNQNYLRTYAAAVADFDKAIGMMMEDLEKKELLDATTILLISDHNTYYSKLSNYVKEIDTRYNSELYRIPCMIYDRKLTEAVTKNGGSLSIEKFTTTSDIIPTVLDMLGIPAWKNLYYGGTVFGDRESIVFSRAYNLFLNDRFIGASLADIKYRSPEATDEDFQVFSQKAVDQVERIRLLDQVFYSDYFKNHPYQP